LLVGDLGEEALLKELRSLFAAAAPDVPVGIGDDAAVIEVPPGTQGVWSTDLLVESIHFERGWQTPRQLGHKCLAVNLSDLASMGATPRFALLSIACPRDTLFDYLTEFCYGFRDLAAKENICVIGGDTTGSAKGLIISVTAGGNVPMGASILRSGAAVGDTILVSGYLGGAAGGLRMMLDGNEEKFPEILNSLREPWPRIDIGKTAREQGATSMTDISDGLASDLRHICEESSVGANIELNLLPVSAEFERACQYYGWDREKMILTGGEDYELLFTLPGGKVKDLQKEIKKRSAVPLTAIGEIMPLDFGIRLVDSDGGSRALTDHGFNHFLTNE